MIAAVGHVQSALAARGIHQGDLVALVMPNSGEFVLAHLALLFNGAITVPLNPRNSIEELERMLGELRPAAVLTDRIREGWIRFTELLSGSDEILLPADVEADDLAAVVLTSGVSGAPRAVDLTHANFAHQARQLGRRLRFTAKDRVYAATGFSGINGLTLGIHAPLTHGAAIAFGSDIPAETTVLIGTPAFHARLLQADEAALSNMGGVRLTVNGDGRVPEHVHKEFVEKFKQEIVSGYGMTETCGLITLNAFPHDENRSTSGEPMGESELAILNESSQRIGAGKEGRIAVRGPSVMRGYHGAPARNQLDWLETDDFGLLDYQGYLTVTAHTTSHIRKGGFPVNTWEIEQLLRTHTAIGDAAVVGISDSALGEDLKAYVVLRNGSNLSASDVIQFVKERVPAYMCPRIVRFVRELPLTPGGKIKRAVLRDDKS